MIRPLDRPAASPKRVSPCCAATSVLRARWSSRQPRRPTLLVHTGPALVFDSIEDFKARVDDPDLDVGPDTVMVLRGCGPRGYPGMPEVGNMPLPAKLLAEGVVDMVRISDARMSGTAFGTTVLHVAPESTVGGPLALVRTGDTITLDVPGRRLTLTSTTTSSAVVAPSGAAAGRGRTRLVPPLRRSRHASRHRLRPRLPRRRQRFRGSRESH